MYAFAHVSVPCYDEFHKGFPGSGNFESLLRISHENPYIFAVRKVYESGKDSPRFPSSARCRKDEKIKGFIGFWDIRYCC